MLAMINQLSLEALLEGFAALGSVVGVISAFAGFLSLISEDSADEIGASISIGAAIGFLPGVLAGVYIYQQVASQTLEGF